MAFPDSVKTFVQAVDPAITDGENIKNYQDAIAINDYTGASEILANITNGIQMNMNAGRFNDALSEIIAIEEFYLGLTGVKAFLLQNASTWTSSWDSATAYITDVAVNYNNNFYVCLENNTNKEPTVAIDWQTYWRVLVTPNPPRKYKVQESLTPEEIAEMEIGEIWAQEIT
jgi:hypothetical protein